MSSAGSMCSMLPSYMPNSQFTTHLVFGSKDRPPLNRSRQLLIGPESAAWNTDHWKDSYMPSRHSTSQPLAETYPLPQH
jgi:hypothetical protein